MPYLEQIPIGLQILRRTPVGNYLGAMNRLFGRRLAPAGVSWVETAPGMPWKVDLGNPCHRWMVYGDYADPGFLKWARESIPEEGIIVDSGTNVGQFLPYFAEIVREGQILAFEPSPYCADWVRECLQVNPDLGVELIEKGLGASEETAGLRRTEEAHGLWGEMTDKPEEADSEIAVTTLEKELSRREISDVSLWKLDVEGHELEALKGAEEYLRDGRIQALYVELTAGNRKEGVRYLDFFGYHSFEADRSGTLMKINTHPEEEKDIIFLR